MPALDPPTEGIKRLGTLQTGGISELELTANSGALCGALSHMLLGKAALLSFPPHLQTGISTASCPVSHCGSSETFVCCYGASESFLSVIEALSRKFLLFDI